MAVAAAAAAMAAIQAGKHVYVEKPLAHTVDEVRRLTLAARQADFAAEARLLLGRDPDISYRYRNATNGLALILTPDEAAVLAESPLVRSIAPDVVYRLDTYAGPEWIGAGVLWNGDAGFPAARGEGVVVGNIDTGINWNHPSFSDSGHNYVNPYGDGLGLCSDPEVLCNEKLVGVYDFVEDDPSTEDWVEENTKGKDNNGHGSHTAGIAAGEPVDVGISLLDGWPLLVVGAVDREPGVLGGSAR